MSPLSTTIPQPTPHLEAPRAREAEDRGFAYLIALARALHAYGTPAHRLEETLDHAARSVSLSAQFLSSPTSILMAVGEGVDQRCHLIRVQPGQEDLGKLMEFDEVVDAVASGELDAAAGAERIRAIAAAPARYAPALHVGAFALASAGAAQLFGGGWREIALSFALGLAIGGIEQLTLRRPRAARVFAPVASCLAAFVSLGVASLGVPLADPIVTVSALIILLPGLMLTVAMSELATGHLVSGTARLAGAMTQFLTMAFGVALGRRLALALDLGPIEPRLPLAGPAWLEAAALVGTPIAFTVLFRARPREAGTILAVCVLGFFGGRYGGELLGPELGAFVGALVVGLCANAYASAARRPAQVLLLPGILMLVPGSIGFQGVTSFLADDALSGVESVFRMALVAVSLVGGMLTANLLRTPRRTL